MPTNRPTAKELAVMRITVAEHHDSQECLARAQNRQIADYLTIAAQVSARIRILAGRPISVRTTLPLAY